MENLEEFHASGSTGLPEEREVREVKVRLPTEQVLRLHFTRMTKRTSVSQIVSTALSRYFNELAGAK